MALVLVTEQINQEDVKKALSDYSFYIKITADIEKSLVVIGGMYHADAEKYLLEKCSSQQKDIWGGGFATETKTWECNALINLRPEQNQSLEVLDPIVKQQFLELVKSKLKILESL